VESQPEITMTIKSMILMKKTNLLTKINKINKRRFNPDTNKTTTTTTTPTIYCDGCGGNNHSRSICCFSNHPDFNKDTSVSWIKLQERKNLEESSRIRPIGLAC